MGIANSRVSHDSQRAQRARVTYHPHDLIKFLQIPPNFWANRTRCYAPLSRTPEVLDFNLHQADTVRRHLWNTLRQLFVFSLQLWFHTPIGCLIAKYTSPKCLWILNRKYMKHQDERWEFPPFFWFSCSISLSLLMGGGGGWGVRFNFKLILYCIWYGTHFASCSNFECILLQVS